MNIARRRGLEIGLQYRRSFCAPGTEFHAQVVKKIKDMMDGFEWSGYTEYMAGHIYAISKAMGGALRFNWNTPGIRWSSFETVLFGFVLFYREYFDADVLQVWWADRYRSNDVFRASTIDLLRNGMSIMLIKEESWYAERIMLAALEDVMEYMHMYRPDAPRLPQAYRPRL